jgi:hypothetical protein
VEDMKRNILIVSQMCDQGHKLVFDSHKCEIIKVGSSRLVTMTKDELQGMMDGLKREIT